MKAFRRFGCAEGSALVAVLAVVTLVTVLMGTVLAVQVVEHRFFRRDVHRVQARYLAEAALYLALERLQNDPSWRADSAAVPLPDGSRGVVAVASFGGYLRVRAAARRGRSRHTVQALVGAAPPEAFSHAIYLWDAPTRVVLAGGARVVGSVVVGPQGIGGGAFEGRRFTGAHEGAVLTHAVVAAPSFDARYLEAGRVACAAFEGARPGGGATIPAPVYGEGDLRLTAADQGRLEHPITVAAAGDLVVEGPLTFPAGTIFSAGGTLVLRGAVRGREGLFCAGQDVVVGAGVQAAGQFLAGAQVAVGGDAYLSFPSLLYAAGEAVPGRAGIVVADRAAVDGLLLQAPRKAPSEQLHGHVVIGTGATVRGAVYSAHETELHGTLYGSLVAPRLYFYASPTGYVNWLRDAVIDVSQRPGGLVVPLGFGASPRLAVLAWQTHTREDADGWAQ